MSNSDKNTLSFQRIAGSDTISQFMEKVNNNFAQIIAKDGGPEGPKGPEGDQGVPTKPKVPIHVWIQGEDYADEKSINEDFEIIGYIEENLTDVKYQIGHLIMLQNAHIYRLELEDNKLVPKFLIALQSYNSGDIINGRNAYIHFAYADSSDGSIGFITDQELRAGNNTTSTDAVSTYSLKRGVNNSVDKPYMGVYSSQEEISPNNHILYTWVKIQGQTGLQGNQGEKGDKGDKGDTGDGYTGQLYSIDLEGDMSNISINIDGKILYENDYCECVLHAYYGNENVKVSINDVIVKLPNEYVYIDDNKIANVDNTSVAIGEIIKYQEQNSYDVKIKFTPYDNFIFPKHTIKFSINVKSTIEDTTDNKVYTFNKNTVWMIKGIVSTFELEIFPQYRTIKLTEDGKYSCENLLVDVYKVEGFERTIFNFNENVDFKLLYKCDNNKLWSVYENGISTIGKTHIELKVVRNFGSNDEEIWDYEDVWVVADGKRTHYYHADLGATESMMVLTTGQMINIGSEEKPIYCAELKDKDGYNITFNPKIYDGTEELNVTNIYIESKNIYDEGTFEYELINNTLYIKKVPYGVEMIPMIVTVKGVYSNNGNDQYISDSISFNIYISTLSDIYTLAPTVSSYNTSTGKDGDTIGCSVFKNNILIDGDLAEYGLKLQYAVHDGGTTTETLIDYTEPLVYGHDDDLIKDEFNAENVAIVFVLSHINKITNREIVRSTVPLIKDGMDGKDGNSWQYIFCRSKKYPFTQTEISDPSNWKNDDDTNYKDSNSEYLGEKEIGYENIEDDKKWYDEHKGVDAEFRYEYQSYRKWDSKNKCWGKYGTPTLYSNYSESGSGYSIIMSNPVAVVPVGDDWSVNKDYIYQTESTFVYLYNNTSNISSHNDVNIELPKNYNKVEHFSVIKDNTTNNVCKVIFTPVVGESVFGFGSNTQYKLPITLTYSINEDNDNDGVIDNFSTTVNWILSPIKGAEDVEVFVDKRVVNTSTKTEHSFKVGYYLISSDNSKTFIENKNKDEKGYDIIITDRIDNISTNTSTISNWQDVKYNFGNTTNCYVVLVDSDRKILDYVNIATVTDGNDGKSAIHLELTQDYISIPANPEGITEDKGIVHPKYNVDIQSQMILYNGNEIIKSNISYSFVINDDPDLDTNTITVDANGGFTIPKNLINGDTNVKCIANYNNIDYSKNIFIDVENIPYELELNKKTLTRDVNQGNKIIDDNLTVCVKYWMDGKWNYTDSGTVRLSTTNGDIVIPVIMGEEGRFARYIKIKDTGSHLENNTVDTEVTISYYGGISTETVLSYETIGIINTAKNAPTIDSSRILGYSLNKDATIDGSIGTSDYDMWFPTLDDILKSVEPKQTIYILNENTLSDGTKNRYITFTLAGTQGVDGEAGKSRVLFYLGSYEYGKATLTQAIKTVFNDNRCDYYIDYYGNAWMRKGKPTNGTETTNAVVTVPKGPGSSNPNWEASTKVGFIQAGAIHADMINTGSITADSAIVSKLFSNEIAGEKLTVDAAKITGKLTANSIDTSDLSVSKLLTNPEIGTSSIKIENNLISVVNKTGNSVCSISDDPIIPPDEENGSIVTFISSDNDREDPYEEISDNSLSIDDNIITFIDRNNDNKEIEFILYEKEQTYKQQRIINNPTIGGVIEGDLSFYNNLKLKNLKVKINPKFIFSKNDYSNSNNYSITITPVVEITNIFTFEDSKGKVTGKKSEESITLKTKTFSGSFRPDGSGTTELKDSFYYGIPLYMFDSEDGDSDPFNNRITMYNIKTSSFKIKFKFKIDAGNSTFTKVIPNLTKIDLGNSGLNSCYTKLSDNGIIINNKTNGLLINDNCIILKFGKYGILLNNDGIQYSTNLNNHVYNLLNANWSSLTSLNNATSAIGETYGDSDNINGDSDSDDTNIELNNGDIINPETNSGSIPYEQ